MKKHTLSILLLLFSNVFAILPEYCPDITLDKALLALEGADFIESDGYIWQVEIHNKTSIIYVHKLDGTIKQLGPYPSDFYWDDYTRIRQVPSENITIRLAGERAIDPTENFSSLCQYDVILAGEEHPIASFSILDPHNIVPMVAPPAANLEENTSTLETTGNLVFPGLGSRGS